MGQRLVVDLIQNGKVVAVVYYHWSAYFISTIHELAALSEAIIEAEATGKNKLEAIVDKLEGVSTNYSGETVRGGVRYGIEELEAASKMIPNKVFKTEFVDRNQGVISFTEEGIKHFHDWEEGHAEIDLDNLTISNNVTLEPDPFVFVDAVYETDEDGYEYMDYVETGRIRLNGRTCQIDAFNCGCGEIIQLEDFINREWEIYRARNSQLT